MDELRTAAETAMGQCVALGPEETCLIVTDENRLEIGTALYEVARTIAEDVVLLQYPPGPEHGAEPPRPVGSAMRATDVFLAPTTKSLSHTRARGSASEAGARGATLPGITPEVFIQGLAADYDRIAAECRRVYEAVTDASEVRVTAPAGTDITFDIGDRSWREDTGLVHEPGSFSNLPAGEVFVSPDSATGTYVVDGTIRPYGKLDSDQTVRIDVEDGYAVEIHDPEVAASFERAEASVGRDAYNVAELGIGTNVAVSELVGSVLLDEKAAGTVHIALGDDASIGGTVDAPIHADGVIRDPQVFVDGSPLELPAPGASSE